jgi:ABC-2 type transport system permease protein
MIWYKAWIETRTRFVVGLALLVCSAAGIVLAWPKVTELLPLAANVPMQGDLGRRVQAAMELSRDYRSYVWSQSFAKNLSMLGVLFAALLGTGGILSQRGGVLFTLSLPVSRSRVLFTGAAVGLAELLSIMMTASLTIPLLSPAVGKHYALGDALIHGVCMFTAAAVFFSLAMLLSTEFGDLWRPLLLTLAIPLMLAVVEEVTGTSIGIFRVMSAEAFFRTGSLPWAGLVISAAASIAMLALSSANIARKDF